MKDIMIGILGIIDGYWYKFSFNYVIVGFFDIFFNDWDVLFMLFVIIFYSYKWLMSFLNMISVIGVFVLFYF